MPRGLSLSELEKGQILAYHDAGWSSRCIAARLTRSKTVINNYLTNPNVYTKKKTRGITEKMSDQDKRRLRRAASNQLTSALKLRCSLGLELSVRRIQQVLQTSPHLKYTKMKKAPWLTTTHMQHRVQWAKNHLVWKDEWVKVIFSDEKKFNLDGPDGLACYWHDVRKEKRTHNTRSHKGGSVMVWGAFRATEKSSLAILDGKINAESYIAMLSDHLVPRFTWDKESELIFQQDNASIHTAYLTKTWFLYHNIRLLDWPAHSPDLNPIENIWGIMTRRVYEGNKCFHTTDELKTAILNEWQKLEPDLLENLIQSMPKRCRLVIENKGLCIS